MGPLAAIEVSFWEMLYERYVGSPNVAQALDQEVTAVALGAGENGNAVSQLLQQGPYVWLQLEVKHMPLTISHDKTFSRK